MDQSLVHRKCSLYFDLPYFDILFRSIYLCKKEHTIVITKKKHYISRNITEKLKIIKEIENEKNLKDVVKEFGVKQSTTKNRDSLKRQGNENPTILKSKKMCSSSSKYPQLNNAVALFVHNKRVIPTSSCLALFIKKPNCMLKPRVLRILRKVTVG
jgi:predicted PilT family ATPase